jgi:hypothetical protein
MRRFTAFNDDQSHQLVQARLHDVRRIILVVSLLVVALASGFGYGLYLVADASSRADSAGRAAAQIIRDRALEAKQLAAANQKKADEGARLAYAACRRQQEATQAGLIGVHVLLADPDPHVHQVAVRYYHFLNAQHLLDVPDCPKPPKGS